MNQVDLYAVFGQPINHSKSPRIHSLFAEQTQTPLKYIAQEVSPEAFDNTVFNFFDQGGKGLNCTVPLKELAWQLASTNLTERARLSKAVNTLYLNENGCIAGDNTDGVGLVTDLTLNHSIPLAGRSILILGAGGASRGIIAPLLEQNPSLLVISNRTELKAHTLAKEFSEYGNITGCGFDSVPNQPFDVILNATSASLSGSVPPIPTKSLKPNGFCYDLAYGNQPTAFVNWGLSHGASKSLDGLGMLVEQAAQAFFIWRGIKPNTTSVIELLNAERSS